MSKFTVGQRVKIVSAKADFKRKFIGNEFEIANVDGPYDKDLNSYYNLRDDATGGWRWADSELELAEETKVMEFQKGDVVKVLRNRNVTGQDCIAGSEYIGTIQEISEKAPFGRNDFDAYWIDGGNQWVRSDDIELVSSETEMGKLFIRRAGIASASKPTAEDDLIEDLLASNERLSDANEAKRERLEAIRAIVTADDAPLKVGGHKIKDAAITTLKIKEWPTLSFGGILSIDFSESPSEELADELDHFTNHLKKLAKRIRKTIAKSNAN